MRLESGEFAKHAAHPAIAAMQRMFSGAAKSPVGQELRSLAINPFLRQQGEFLAGSGKTLSDVLADWAQTAGASGMAQRLSTTPIPDAAVGLGLGGLGGLTAGRLMYGGPGE